MKTALTVVITPPHEIVIEIDDVEEVLGTNWRESLKTDEGRRMLYVNACPEMYRSGLTVNILAIHEGHAVINTSIS